MTACSHASNARSNAISAKPAQREQERIARERRAANAEKEREDELTRLAKQKVIFRRARSGNWGIEGTNLCVGQTVEVHKRNGDTQTVHVVAILEQRGETTLAAFADGPAPAPVPDDHIVVDGEWTGVSDVGQYFERDGVVYVATDVDHHRMTRDDVEWEEDCGQTGRWDVGDYRISVVARPATPEELPEYERREDVKRERKALMRRRDEAKKALTKVGGGDETWCSDRLDTRPAWMDASPVVETIRLCPDERYGSVYSWVQTAEIREDGTTVIEDYDADSIRHAYTYFAAPEAADLARLAGYTRYDRDHNQVFATDPKVAALVEELGKASRFEAMMDRILDERDRPPLDSAV